MNQKGSVKSFIAGIIGTTIEWYDFGLFGFLAPVIAELFFPAQEKWVSLLQTFTIFAIGYFLRPLGGAFFGSVADRFGRVIALRSTILLTSLPSLLIACLPTYASIGILSTVLLIVLRLLQGLSVGGEFAGSMVYLNEIAAPRFRVLLSGLSNNASNIGVLLGVGLSSLLSFLMPHDLFLSIGWRIPFFVGGILGIAGYQLRKIFIESYEFLLLQKEKKLHQKPLKVLFKKYKPLLILGTLMCWMGACGIYILTVYLSTYLSAIKHYTLNEALSLQSILLILTLFFVPAASLLSNYFNKVTLLKIAVCGNMLYAFWGFAYLPSNNIYLAGASLLPLIIFISIEQGIMPTVLSEIFPTAVRYSAVSISYNLSYAYIGGAAPMYVTWLIDKFQNPCVPAYCIMLASLMTGLALALLFPTRQKLCMLQKIQNVGFSQDNI
ncbi:MAG TPA: MFS transporter [Gammaproteobacteria bacterium]|nr:MFS transporter [Gammaproteobacteria bacterium]